MLPREGMTKFKAPLILFGLTVLTRLPFTSKYLFSSDSVQFALGMKRFDVSLHQPHPPGYFLYVMAGRLAQAFTTDANAALVLVSIVTGAFTVALVYCLGRDLFDERAGLAAGVFALTSPLIWFHGEVALSYMPEAMMSVMFAYVCLRVMRGEQGLFWLAAVILGVSGGIRQNSTAFLMPLWLYSMKGIGLRRVVIGVLVFCATLAAWMLPMFAATGGYEAYRSALGSQWAGAVWRGITAGNVLRDAGYVANFVFYGLGVASGPLLALAYFRLKKRPMPPWDMDKAAFLAVWLAPGILFHTLVFFQPGAPGYVLIYLVGLLVIAGRALTAVSEAAAGSWAGLSADSLRRITLIFVAAVNIAFFLFRTDALSAGGIKEHDAVIENYVRAVRAGFSPADTEIVGTTRFFCGYRHAMYYLPEFKVHDDNFNMTPDGPRIFWCQDGVTHMERFIEPLPATRRFIYFVNCDGGCVAALPKTAKAEPVGGGNYLVHYDSLAELCRAADMDPETIKGPATAFR